MTILRALPARRRTDEGLTRERHPYRFELPAAPTTFPPLFRSAKRGASALRDVVRSAMANRPGRSAAGRPCPPRPISLHDPRRVRDYRIQRLVVDGPSVLAADRRRRSMDAGVPLKAPGRPVSAMGLVLKRTGIYAVPDRTSLGDEDHPGRQELQGPERKTASPACKDGTIQVAGITPRS